MDRRDSQRQQRPRRPRAQAATGGMVGARVRRRFTLAEARRTLPLVGRVAADVVAAHAVAADLHRRLSLNPSRDDRARLEAELDAAVARLQRYVDELTDVGCELKDYATGLVDYVVCPDGRDVAVCWRVGEPTIAYWHELDAGYAGRRPIDERFQPDLKL